MFAYAGVLNGQSPVFFVVSIGGTAELWACVPLFSASSARAHSACAELFIRNGYMGWITWSGLMLDYLLKLYASH
jgi:4-hydroxybenzoate polyprenyltransferase